MFHLWHIVFHDMSLSLWTNVLFQIKSIKSCYALTFTFSIRVLVYSSWFTLKQFLQHKVIAELDNTDQNSVPKIVFNPKSEIVQLTHEDNQTPARLINLLIHLIFPPDELVFTDNRTTPSRSVSRLSYSSGGSGSAWGPRSSSYLPGPDDSEGEDDHDQLYPLYQSHLGFTHTSQESLNSTNHPPQVFNIIHIIIFYHHIKTSDFIYVWQKLSDTHENIFSCCKTALDVWLGWEKSLGEFCTSVGQINPKLTFYFEYKYNLISAKILDPPHVGLRSKNTNTPFLFLPF